MDLPTEPINLSDYHLARAQLSPMAYAYFAGGAADEITLRENTAAFERIRLRPRVMVDVRQRDTTTSVLGQPVSMPVLVAPLAFLRLAHPEGELAVAQAAARAGVVMVLSTLATTSLEEVARTGGPRWFQLYVYRDRGVTHDLVRRAETAGYQALVVTVDAAVPGRRERDLRQGFHLPPGLLPANLTPYTQGKAAHSEEAPSAERYPTVAGFDPSLKWSDLDWLCSLTRLPVLVKGILRPDDASRAVEHGARGIIVSNHGGRQLDAVVASLEALPGVVEAAGGQVEVLMDGGVRRGAHVLMALALGAKAVLVGRPIIWGLAVNGEQGVADVLRLLCQEFDTAMALCGCATVDHITRDLVA